MKIPQYKKHLINKVIKPLFKESGFLVSGLHWRKNEPGFTKIFNIQLSQFNTPESFQFYINIGLFFPHSYRLSFTSKFWGGEMPEIPTSPKIQNCQFAKRDQAIFGRNRDYSFSRNTDRVGFEKLILEDVENEYLPFLEGLDSLDSCRSFLNGFYGGYQYDYHIALGMVALGRTSEAKVMIDNIISLKKPPEEFLIVLNEELGKLGLDFNLPLEKKDSNDGNIDFSKGSYP
ncbi:MAG: DUF4304 domain-containing protein [Bacteroidetes bacterium]|nr:DUF4304 domain-containing protein [Bacteroidota bacterium]MCB0844638.1 DUF4304 domain-containing protein [Bacteroidota bacterium]